MSSRPDIYNVLSRGLDWEPTYVDPANTNLERYQTKVHYKNWENFRDPFKMYYKEYVRIQAEKENTFHALREAADRYGHTRSINQRWLQGQKLFLAAIPLTEYAILRTHSYFSRIAPAQVLRIALMNQAMDEMRHAQNDFYLARDYNKYHQGFENGALWRQNHPIIYNTRTYAEEALTAQDPFETIVGFNFCFEVCHTNTLFVSVPATAAANGDFVFAQMQLSTQSDESRHMAIGMATIRALLEEDERNVPMIQNWFDKWYWRTHRIMAPATSLFLDYFGENRVESYKDVFHKYVVQDFVGGAVKDLEELGLKPPRFLEDSIREVDTMSLTTWRAFWQMRDGLFFKMVPPNEEDRAWLKSHYPAWKNTFEELWDSDTPDIKNFAVNCQVCHLPCVFPDPVNPTIRKTSYSERMFWFCSDGCKWIFEQEPVKYSNDRTWTEVGIYNDNKTNAKLLGLDCEPPLGGTLEENHLKTGY